MYPKAMETILELDPLTEFFSAIKSPDTKRNYDKDLKRFFDHLKLEGDTNSQARGFAKRAKLDGTWATNVINGYIFFQKERVENFKLLQANPALFCGK